MSITLVTGLPGSGKTLLTVGELLPDFLKQKIQKDGLTSERPLKSNINGLLLEHSRIDADDLAKWPEWAQAGDVICFDEVQETWRPRAMGIKTPDAIAKLETHRHMGVDFVLMTQHPMLLDQNIRRLVDRHIHVRRVGNFGAAVLYEWDHCSNPSMVKSAFSTRPWRYPKAAFQNYKSSHLHTKRPRRLPAAGLVVIAAIVALGFFGKTAYGRLTDRYTNTPQAVSGSPPGVPPHIQGLKNETSQPQSENTQPGEPVPASSVPPEQVPVIAGCVWTPKRCACVDTQGHKIDPDDDSCKSLGVGPVQSLSWLPEPSRPVDPSDLDVISWLAKQRRPSF